MARLTRSWTRTMCLSHHGSITAGAATLRAVVRPRLRAGVAFRPARRPALGHGKPRAVADFIRVQVKGVVETEWVVPVDVWAAVRLVDSTSNEPGIRILISTRREDGSTLITAQIVILAERPTARFRFQDGAAIGILTKALGRVWPLALGVAASRGAWIELGGRLQTALPAKLDHSRPIARAPEVVGLAVCGAHQASPLDFVQVWQRDFRGRAGDERRRRTVAIRLIEEQREDRIAAFPTGLVIGVIGKGALGRRDPRTSARIDAVDHTFSPRTAAACQAEHKPEKTHQAAHRSFIVGASTSERNRQQTVTVSRGANGHTGPVSGALAVTLTLRLPLTLTLPLSPVFGGGWRRSACAAANVVGGRLGLGAWHGLITPPAHPHP